MVFKKRSMYSGRHLLDEDGRCFKKVGSMIPALFKHYFFWWNQNWSIIKTAIIPQTEQFSLNADKLQNTKQKQYQQNQEAFKKSCPYHIKPSLMNHFNREYR